ncbi:MAG: hypothetical protein ACREHC_04075 [Candidatus Levyibacteriota bacterium]
MYTRSVIIKYIIFILGYVGIFWAFRHYNIFPQNKLAEDLKSIPTMFSAANFIYSIFTAFIIQAQWQKCGTLIDANRGELRMLRQLFIVAHHFPVKERNDIRFHIYRYLNLIMSSTIGKNDKDLRYRSKKVDEALIRIEDSMFEALKKYPDIGPLAFSYLTNAMEYREQKLQIISQFLPLGLRLFVVFSTFTIIFSSFFLPFSSIFLNFYFNLVLAILAFGVYLIIEDFDHPYRPGIHYLSNDGYQNLMKEIKNKLEYYNFDFAKAEGQETKGIA